VRLVVPGWYGMTHVKWLRSITLIDEPFTGYQQTHTYWYKQSEDDAGRPVTRVAVKSLMLPPGIPDFLTRRRVVDAGPVELTGRAWSGDAPVTGVDVTVDGGATWHAATLGEALGPYAWAPWSWTWHARPGTYRLGCRATDASGARQPADQPWNLQGMANNGVHWVDATVR
jgi:DMSO/TMAO reductase YedYZ molybdopterin-dependent catalytic subunit